MTTPLDAKIIPRVKSIVAVHGKSVIFVEDGKKSYDVTSGSVQEAGPKRYTAKVTPPEMYEARLIDGVKIQIDDCKIGLPSQDLEFVPKIGMTVIVDSEEWKVMRVGSIFSGDLVALYYPIQLRR